MRQLLHGDVVAAARALLAAPAETREATMVNMLLAADIADHYRKTLGRAHPRYGTGSLMAAASGWPQPPEPGLDDSDYLACLICVLSVIRSRKEAARPQERNRAAKALS